MPRSPDPGLQVSEDLRFQRRDWRMQRAGWIGMALVLLAAAAGLFGVGPLSWASATASDGALLVEYQRFTRLKAPTSVRVHVAAEAGRDGPVRVWVDRTYLEKMQVEGVLPQPQTVELAGERLIYAFPIRGNGPATVTFRLASADFGLVEGAIGLERETGAEAGAKLQQLVYP